MSFGNIGRSTTMKYLTEMDDGRSWACGRGRLMRRRTWKVVGCVGIKEIYLGVGLLNFGLSWQSWMLEFRIEDDGVVDGRG